MFKSKLSVLVCSIGLASTLSPVAQAGAMTGGSTEVTQILNNFELVMQVQQQVKTVSELVTGNVTMFNQLKEQIQAGLKIGNVGIGDVLQLKSDLESYQGALRQLGGDLPKLSQVFDLRMTEARLQNLTLEQYVTREGARIQQGNAQAKARVDREVAQVEQIKRDVILVRELGDKIPTTSGVHASSQLLNSQMNVMLQQMTRLVALTSEAQGSDKAEAKSKELAARQDALLVREGLSSLHETQKAKERSQIEAGRR